MYHKGRVKRCKAVFGADDQTQAYKLAQDDGKKKFPRHRWHIVGCVELTNPPVS